MFKIKMSITDIEILLIKAFKKNIFKRAGRVFLQFRNKQKKRAGATQHRLNLKLCSSDALLFRD
jgi:hypothetical protein